MADRARLALPFRAVAVGHAGLVIAQPVSAGALLEASATARAVHAGVGGFLLLVALVQIPLAVLAWWPGRLPAWPVAVSVLLFAAETTQLTLGYAGALAVHLPLGVAVVAAVVALAVWAVRVRSTPRRPIAPRSTQ